jgi:hypothetical protein
MQMADMSKAYSWRLRALAGLVVICFVKRTVVSMRRTARERVSIVSCKFDHVTAVGHSEGQQFLALSKHPPTNVIGQATLWQQCDNLSCSPIKVRIHFSYVPI